MAIAVTPRRSPSRVMENESMPTSSSRSAAAATTVARSSRTRSALADAGLAMRRSIWHKQAHGTALEATHDCHRSDPHLAQGGGAAGDRDRPGAAPQPRVAADPYEGRDSAGHADPD